MIFQAPGLAGCSSSNNIVIIIAYAQRQSS
jgi:hypothetical protein